MGLSGEGFNAKGTMLFNVYKYYLLTRIYFGLRVFVSGSAYLYLAPRILFLAPRIFFR